MEKRTKLYTGQKGKETQQIKWYMERQTIISLSFENISQTMYNKNEYHEES